MWQSHGVKVLGDYVKKKSGIVGAPQNSLAAINATNSNFVLIERNSVAKAGYIGIRFNRNTQVVNNVVRDTCLVLDDCGAIYSWANADPQPLKSEVIGNIVENVVGNRTGNPEPWTLAAGIYLDELSSSVMVRENTIINAERGIYIHNAFDNTVQNNTVVDSRAYGLFLGYSHESISFTALRANTLNSNILVNTNGIPFVYYLDRMNRQFSDIMEGNIYLGDRSEGRFVLHRQGASIDFAKLYSDVEFRHLPGKVSHGAYRATVNTPILLVNARAEEKLYPCPLPTDTSCTNATDVKGGKLIWPVKLPPFSSLVVLN